MYVFIIEECFLRAQLRKHKKMYITAFKHAVRISDIM